MRGLVAALAAPAQLVRRRLERDEGRRRGHRHRRGDGRRRLLHQGRLLLLQDVHLLHECIRGVVVAMSVGSLLYSTTLHSLTVH